VSGRRCNNSYTKGVGAAGAPKTTI
jgi:hypothetical protein